MAAPAPQSSGQANQRDIRRVAIRQCVQGSSQHGRDGLGSPLACRLIQCDQSGRRASSDGADAITRAQAASPSAFLRAASLRTRRPRIVDRIMDDRHASGDVKRASVPCQVGDRVLFHGPPQEQRKLRIPPSRSRSSSRWASSSPCAGASRRAVQASCARTPTSGSRDRHLDQPGCHP